MANLGYPTNIAQYVRLRNKINNNGSTFFFLEEYTPASKISTGVHPGWPAREIFIGVNPGRLELEIVIGV